MNTQLNEQLRKINVAPKPVRRLKSIFEIISDVDERVRTSILFSTVVSLNSMVIANVGVHVRNLRTVPAYRARFDARTSLDIRNEQDEANRTENVEHPESPYTSGYDGMTAEDIARHGNGAELVDYLQTAQQVHAVRDYLLDEYIQLAHNPKDLSYHASLNYSLAREARPKSSDAKLQQLVDILGVPEIVSVESLKHLQIKSAERSNKETADAADDILNLTDAFNHGASTEDEAAACFDALSQKKQLQIVNAIWRAACRGIAMAMANDNFDTIADALMLKRVKEDAEELLEQYKTARAQELAN